MSKLVTGVNDLQTTHPEIAAEWNYEKNNPLTPKEIMAGSGKRIWWKCRLGHEWRTAVYHRKEGHGCPYCSSRMAMTKSGKNDLLTLNPQLAAQWDEEKNMPLTPGEVTIYSQMKVWWRCEYEHSWKSTVNKRTKGQNCPYCAGIRVWKGFNDLATTHPKLLEEWDCEKNLDLDPSDFMAGSSKEVWWNCRYGHSWKAIIYSRKAGNGCPICAGNILIPGTNDLQTLNPEAASSWNYEKNTPLTPAQVAANSSEKVWWKCSLGHSWRAAVYSRNGNKGCPYCSGNKVLTGFNDLLSQVPSLCEEWDVEKNRISPDQITVNSKKQVWWKDSLGHSWKAKIVNRSKGHGCPYCGHTKVLKGFNDLASKDPDLAAQWHPIKNGALMPDQVMPRSQRYVWWICKEGHEWKAKVADRQKNGCPYCSNRRVLSGYNDFAFVHPELLSEWDYEKNSEILPECVVYSTSKAVWWKCSKGHSWRASCYKRHGGQKCPYCAGILAYPGFNDLQSKAEWLLEEWDWERNHDVTPDQLLPFTNRKVWWRCSNGHHWRSSVNSRHKGIGCPYCSGRFTTRTHIVP